MFLDLRNSNNLVGKKNAQTTDFYKKKGPTV